MLKRASRIAAARTALVLMLFAQGAMAWAACELPERSPALALGMAVAADCCDADVAAKAPVSAVCFAHCLAEKQSLYKASLDEPAAPSKLMALVMGVATPQERSRATMLAEPVSTGPPRRILLQSFQI